MNVCDKCGYKVISRAMFAKHLATHEEVPPVPEAPPVSTESPTLVESAKPAEPVVFHSDEITLKFTKAVEVYINGIPYCGTEIKVKNMEIASEIVRIARDAYGPHILA